MGEFQGLIGNTLKVCGANETAAHYVVGGNKIFQSLVDIQGSEVLHGQLDSVLSRDIRKGARPCSTFDMNVQFNFGNQTDMLWACWFDHEVTHSPANATRSFKILRISRVTRSDFVCTS